MTLYFDASVQDCSNSIANALELLQANGFVSVIILSVNGDAVREFLLTAWDLGMIQSGEYVFMDVELFPFPGDYWGNHHWRRGDDKDDIAKYAAYHNGTCR